MSKRKTKMPAADKMATPESAVEPDQVIPPAADARTEPPAAATDDTATAASTPPDNTDAAAAAASNREEDEALEHRLLRLQADFDNYRKRTQRERAEWQRAAHEEILRDCLPVMDHYELGLKTAAKEAIPPAVLEGLQMVYDQFLSLLRKHKVVPIEAEGKPFDHNFHEAVTQIPSEEHPADTVIAETRRGYLLGEKLLRPAQVVVSSGPATDTEATPAAEQEEIA